MNLGKKMKVEVDRTSCSAPIHFHLLPRCSSAQFYYSHLPLVLSLSEHTYPSRAGGGGFSPGPVGSPPLGLALLSKRCYSSIQAYNSTHLPILIFYSPGGALFNSRSVNVKFIYFSNLSKIQLA
jgi:hypothetical protein